MRKGDRVGFTLTKCIIDSQRGIVIRMVNYVFDELQSDTWNSVTVIVIMTTMTIVGCGVACYY